MSKVSVIIPTYNCADYLKFSIESALSQSYKNIEIILVDDGSTDNTRCLSEHYKDRIKYIYQKNKGLSCARNTGIFNSTGNYIALLDSDDIWLPNRLERQMEIFESNNDIGLIHADVIMINEENIKIGTYTRNTKLLSGYISNNLLLRKSHISCPTVIFKKKCLEKVGMFDEELTRLGAEDRDLWIRITKRYKAFYIDEPLALYRIRKNSMSRNEDKMLKARKYVVNKYCENNLSGFLLKLRSHSAIYLDFADSDRSEGMIDQAERKYLMALKYFPFNLKALWNLIKMNLKSYAALRKDFKS